MAFAFVVQVNVIHTANPVEHANNAVMQASFINPVHHASVDLSGHNLVNAHQASGSSKSSAQFYSRSPPPRPPALPGGDYRLFTQKWGMCAIWLVCPF